MNCHMFLSGLNRLAVNHYILNGHHSRGAKRTKNVNNAHQVDPGITPTLSVRLSTCPGDGCSLWALLPSGLRAGGQIRHTEESVFPRGL